MFAPGCAATRSELSDVVGTCPGISLASVWQPASMEASSIAMTMRACIS